MSHPNPAENETVSEYAKRQVEAPHPNRWPWLAAACIGVIGFALGSCVNTAQHAPSRVSSTAPTTNPLPSKGLWTCAMHPQVIQPEPGICPICHMELVPLKSGNASLGLQIDPVVVQNMGVRTVPVVRGPVMQSVRVVGYLEEPEPLHRDINLRVNGWIEKLYANIDGMVITKGQPLFDLYSPELSVAIDELIAARQQVDRSADANARQLMESSRRKLQQFGLEDAQIESLAKLESAPRTVPILAPLEGHMTAKMVYEGAAVKAGDLVMRLASRHEMWIDAQVPEQEMSMISDGQPVRTTFISQPGKVFDGKVLFIHPHLDPQTRTALVRVQIENPQLALREGMFATVEILADTYREAPLVPREAVIDTGRRQVVFVALGDGRFEPRDVTLGPSGNENEIEVISGVSAGENVVTSGQFLLDSESRLKDAVAKHLFAGMQGHPAATTQPSAPAAAATTAPTQRIPVPHAMQILHAYLDLSAKLGARQASDDPVDASSLIDTSSMATAHGSGQGSELASHVAESAKALNGKTIAQQREAFVALSKAVIDLARHADLSGESPKAVYVFHCPMAFHEAGADWIQESEKTANPYYATEMKGCGEVVEKIGFK